MADSRLTHHTADNAEIRMRCLRGFRRHRLRYLAILGVALLFLVLVHMGVFTQQKVPRHRAGGEEVEAGQAAARRPTPDLSPQEWKIGSKERARMLQLLAQEKVLQQEREKKKVVAVRPGEQVLNDDIQADILLLPDEQPAVDDTKLSDRKEVPQLSVSNRFPQRDVKHVSDDRLEKGAESEGKAIENAHEEFDRKADSVVNDAINAIVDGQIEASKTEKSNGAQNKAAGRDDQVVNLLPDDMKSGKSNGAQNEAVGRDKQVVNLLPGNVKLEKSNGEQNEAAARDDQVVNLLPSDVKLMRRARTPPPWTQTRRPLRPEDYSANCSKGSLPSPGSSFHTDKFCLVEDHHNYFGDVSNRICYYKGTDGEKTAHLKTHAFCACWPGWHGKYCSMPDVVFRGGYPYEYGVERQVLPRRIIYAFPFNNEFDMLETTLNSLTEAVDVFLILESNYTAAGERKERVLLQRLKNNYLHDLQYKIVYVALDYFPRVAYTDGWAADALLRNHLGQVAFSSVLQNVRDDDIIISLDADEIPLPEALMFVKLHYGYPEPFGFVLRHSVFGYFWRALDGVSTVYGGARVALIRDLLGGHLYDLRNGAKNVGRDANAMRSFRRQTGTRIRPWVFGSAEVPAGWHCSWCFLPPAIRYKLLSAHASDFPRWGTFPDKTKLTFISGLVERGRWFDEKTDLLRAFNGEDDYAPPYIEDRLARFASLLNHTAYMTQSKQLLAQQEPTLPLRKADTVIGNIDQT